MEKYKWFYIPFLPEDPCHRLDGATMKYDDRRGGIGYGHHFLQDHSEIFMLEKIRFGNNYSVGVRLPSLIPGHMVRVKLHAVPLGMYVYPEVQFHKQGVLQQVMTNKKYEDEICFTVPESAHEYRVVVRCCGKGDVWLEGIEIEDLSIVGMIRAGDQQVTDHIGALIEHHASDQLLVTFNNKDQAFYHGYRDDIFCDLKMTQVHFAHRRFSKDLLMNDGDSRSMAAYLISNFPAVCQYMIYGEGYSTGVALETARELGQLGQRVQVYLYEPVLDKNRHLPFDLRGASMENYPDQQDIFTKDLTGEVWSCEEVVRSEHFIWHTLPKNEQILMPYYYEVKEVLKKV